MAPVSADMFHRVRASLTAFERLVASRNCASYLLGISRAASGLDRIDLLLRAAIFEEMASRAAAEMRLSEA